MKYSPSEKLEIIRIVEDSELSVRQTLKEIGEKNRKVTAV